MINSFISIIVPCKNEEGYISGCLDSLVNNTYPHNLMEILVVDGMSVDMTPSIIKSYQEKYNFISLLENPKKIFPSAVNIGIQKACGNLIFIAGAHAVYDKDYLRKSVQTSLKYEADNVGGVIITREQENTFAAKAITFVLSSRFGVGNSTFRTGTDKIQQVDTVFGGCYKRNIFAEIGYFHEELISTSDYEFNKRLRNNGGKIILNPDIKATYYTRTTFKKFIKNNIRNGYWAIFPIYIADYIPVSVRHLIPLMFVLSILTATITTIFVKPFLFILLLIFASHYLFSLIFTLIGTFNPVKVLVVPLFFFILHFSYGIGSLYALINILFRKMRIIKD